MDTAELPTEELKQRARRGDAGALQTLRERGFFQKRPAVVSLPASGAQRNLWLAVEKDPSADGYLVTRALRLRGPLRRPAFRRALEALAARHPALRSRFAEVGGELRQFIEPASPLPLIEADCRNAGNPEANCRELLLAAADVPFDLRAAPLWRVFLHRVGEEDHVCTFFIHHLIADAWSLEIIQDDLAAGYQAACAGRDPSLGSSGDGFAARPREPLADARRYWREKLADSPGPLPLPFDFPAAGPGDSTGATWQTRWDALRTEALQEFAAQHGTTLFAALRALVKVLLYRYTGETDLLLAAPHAGREAAAEREVGHFVHLLLLRDRIDPQGGFRRLLAQAHETTVAALAHAACPPDDVSEDLAADAPPLPQPNVLFALQNVAPGRASLPDLRVGDFPLETARANHDLTFEFAPVEGELLLRVTYRTARFAPETAARMGRSLERLLEGVLAQPDAPLGHLPLLSRAEEQQLAAWNPVDTDAPPVESVPALFARQAARAPDAVALTAGGTRMNYGELEARARSLAACLAATSRPDARGTMIGLFLGQSPEAVVAMLGILQAGAAYVPLDPELPAERLELLLHDAGISLLVTTSSLAARLPPGLEVICLDRALPTFAESCSPPLPTDPAYVIFTSGSTGRPKGVCVPHSAIVRLVRATNYVRLGPGDRIAQAATIAFDAATFEIWGALLNGATVHLLAREDLLDPERFAREARVGSFNVLFLTTALFNRLAQSDAAMFGGLDYLLFGGEAVDPRRVQAVLASGARPRHLLHVYGPTETTTFATWHEVRPADAEMATIPIGQPVSGTRAFLLDAERQMVPPGVTGELYLGGAGRALGYVNRPDLTAERFVEIEGLGRLYRSGDLCRRRASDGAIEFLGRLDHQVKLRGFRIEPAEIEAHLRQELGVAEAVVEVRGEGEERGLVAWLVARAGALDLSALRETLRRRLPAYMVPEHLVVLESLPLTANGKIDRRLLPAPAEAEATAGRFHTSTEELLAQLWCAVLGRTAVSREDRFFDLGGHSLTAMRLLPRLRRAFEVELPLHVVFEEPSLAGLAARIDRLRRAAGPLPPPLVALPAGSEWALSFAQERLWFLSQLQAGAAETYGINAALRLDGPLDEPALRAALRALTLRHAVLRSSFRERGGRPYVELRAPYDPLVVQDAGDWPVDGREETIRAAAQAHARRPFDLAHDPLLRVTLLAGAGEGSVLLLSVHHIVADGWSLGILVNELSAGYAAALAGREADLPALPIQYGDYTGWQRGWLQGAALEGQLVFWREHLAGAPDFLALPCDFPRPAARSQRGAQWTHTLPSALAADLGRLSRGQDATLFMTLLAAFQVLLYRYSGQEDFVVGAPVARRADWQTEELVGFFVNTMALRARLSPKERFTARIAAVRRTLLAALAHQDLPFEKLVTDLQPGRALGHSPLFQVMFALENLPFDELRLGARTACLLPQDPGTAKFDLLVSFSEGGGTLSGVWEYSTDLFTAETIAQMAASFECLLQAVAADPEQPLQALPLMSEAERGRELARAEDAPYPCEATIARLFEAQARLVPDATALVDEEERLSYAELDARSNRLARVLRQRGVGPEVLVGVCLERGVAMICALLAILKAGGAYVPLDPAYPAARLALMVANAGLEVIVTTRSLSPGLPAGRAAALLCLDDCAGEIAAQNPAPLNEGGANAENLCYVLYTSGSTGEPKGVAVPHRAVVRLVCNSSYAEFSPTAVFLQLAPLSFDASTFEIWGSLLHGATLVLYPARPLSLDELSQTLRSHRVTTLWLTAGLFHLVVEQRLEALGGLRQLLAGGDVLSVEHVQKVLAACPECTLINGYGPTENTTFTCTYRVPPGGTLRASVPIGRAIAHTTVYLLDAHRQPVPPGVPGELYTGGDGLARGYLNRPELTAERFVEVEGLGRLYRTGDLCRRRPDDGEIEFLSRLDHQVKLRGFRIEPGEIEAVLRREPGISEAVVMTHGEGEHRHLVGYVVAAEGQTPDLEALRASLGRQLPEHMIPARLAVLAEFPLNASGKIDRRRLSAQVPPEPAADAGDFEAPLAGVEARLAAIWSVVLGGRTISRNANFFALGGDSILSIQIVAKAREAGLRLGVRDIFQYQTVAELAPQAVPVVETAAEDEPPGPVPLTPIQEWFFARNLPEPWHFNQAVLLRPGKDWDAAVLRSALAAVCARHGAFHLRFEQAADGWHQSYRPAVETTWLQEEDLRHLPPDRQTAALRERADSWQGSLDLREGPLARAVLFHLHDGQRLLWCVHHLAVDGVSWRILLGDLRTALQAAKPPLPPPAVSFAAWARRLDRHAQTAAIDAEAAYWEQMPAPPPLPVDFPDGHPDLAGTEHCTLRLEKEETRSLLENIHRAYRLQVDDVLLTALALACADWTGRRDCLVEVEGHGRVERPGLPAVTGTVGWFTTIHPVYLTLPDTGEPAACLKAIKEQLRAVPGEGLAYGLRRYREAAPWKGRRDASLTFNYLGQYDQVVGAGPFGFASEGAGESHGALGDRTHLINIDALVSGGELQVHWSYSRRQFRAETIERFAQAFRESLRSLLAHCRLPASVGCTPSDFPLAGLDQTRLDALSAQHGGNLAAVYPVSPMQQGMLFQALYGAEGQQPYFEQVHCRIEAPFDPVRFRAAWTKLLQRHPILRTAFALEETPPRQIVLREVALPWTETDLRALDEPAQRRCLEQTLAEERRNGFDLSRAPLFRCALTRLGEERYAFTWCFHHLLFDGWSLPILFRELQQLYAEPDGALPPRKPYEDYIAWWSRQDAGAAARHWRQALTGFAAPTPLPGTSLIPHGPGGAADRETVCTLDPAASQRLLDFAAGQRLTLNTVLQGAWALLLHRLSGENDVVFGVTVSGRDIDLPGVEGMLGLLINTLPLRVRCRGEEPVGPWLHALQEQHQANMPFAHLPLAEIQRDSELAAGTPLFHTLFVFENYPTGAGLQENPPQAALRFAEIKAVDRTHYPLTLVAGMSQSLHLRLGYDSRYFDDENIQRLLSRFRTLLAGLTDAGPHDRLKDLETMDEPEQRLVQEWSRARTADAPVWTLAARFAAQVARAPDRVAAVCEGKSLTYGELNARAQRLARRLRRQGAGPDQLVALYAERSLDLIVGAVGIVASGAAYLPINPDTPPERLAFLLGDAKVLAAVTQRPLADRLPPLADGRLVFLEDLDEELPHEEAETAPPPTVEPHHLAYVIYTSGSTGQPKGVLVTHANVARLFSVTEAEFGFTADDVWTLFHSIAFDFSVWELWGALLYGGRLVVVPKLVQDPVAFYDLLGAEGVTVLNQTPLAFRQLIPVAEAVRRPLALRLVIFGGEALDLPALAPWFALHGDRQPRLVNMYGITETTVHVTWCWLQRADAKTTASLIGRPLPDLGVFLLDADGRPVPQGAPGEIHVSGAGLARGYLNRPELTAERFVERTVFGRRERLYRSGDRARWRADGSLEYLGRIDQQIKLRGFRIELGEIEATLGQHPGVREAVAIVRGSGPQQALAAYVIPRENGLVPADLRIWLAARLPEYMVPVHFHALPALPMTVNGKLDRMALPEPVETPAAPEPLAAPRDAVEEQLLTIWQAAMGLPAVGVHDDFFALGGHSLMAMQIVSGIYRQLQLRVPLRQFFENPSVARLARAIGNRRAGVFRAIEPAPPQADYPLSHAQQRIWFDAQIARGANYNLPEALRLDEEIDLAALTNALHALLERHEILRTAFVVVAGEPRQRILPRLSVPWREVDLRAEADYERLTRELINGEANQPFDLAQPPLFRVTCIRQPGGRSVFALVLHHIIGDAWSKTVLYRELLALYAAFHEGRPDPLPPPRLQYKDYAAWQSTQTFDQERRHWAETLAGASTRVALPRDFPPPPAAERLFHGERLGRLLPANTSRGLRDLAAVRRTTVSNVLLALFKLFLFRLTRQRDLCVCTAVAARHHPDLDAVLGCFVNLLPIRTRLAPEMEFEALLDQVTQASYQALEQQHYPFDLLIRQIDRSDGANARPFLDVVYVFQSAPALQPETGPGTEAAPAVQSLELSFGFVKFDLCLVAEDRGEAGIHLSLEYDSQVLRAASVEKYLRALASFADLAAASAATEPAA